ncbi:MAG: hypothetical protein EBU08_05480 [Micrococcales bacterium]|nr:hypothetical protein [Micrococcales bacterium]
MHEIFNNTFHKHTIVLYKNNVATDPDSIPTVSVYNAETDEFITSGSAIYDDGRGQYYYQITPSLSNVDRNLRIQWTYSFNSASVSENSFAAVVTPYATLPEIISELKIGVQTSDDDYIDPEQILFAERLARIQVENYTMQSFSKRTGVQTIYGIGANSLFLTEKMLSVNCIYEDDILIYSASTGYNDLGGDIVLSDTGKTIYLDVNENSGTVPRPTQDVLISSGKIGRFKDGKRYTVTGVIGWQYVPQDIRTATVMLVSDILSGDYQWRNKYLDKINLSEITFQLNSSAFLGTGNSIVDSILDAYKNIGIVLI